MSKRTVRYFISYTRDDKKLPDKLLTELRKKLGADADYDFQPWRDTDILVGTDWNDSIQTALKECDFGLLLVSPAFLGKKYITEKELPHFVGGDKPCVPVTLSRLDFDEMDLKGLAPSQFFGLVPKNDVHPRSFEECRTQQDKSEFSLDLYRKIKKRLAVLFADTAPRPDAIAGGIDASAYRAHIRKHYRHLHLEALGGDTFYRDVELQQVFIPQDVRDCGAWLPAALEGPAELTRQDADTSLAELHEQKRFQEARTRDIFTVMEDPLGLGRYVGAKGRVLLGAPGAGKSSFTRISLLRWVEANPDAALPIPVLVELRRFHRSGSADFLDYLAQDKDLVFHFPREALDARLRDGTAELLFDGLDEIFDPEHRATVTRLIARCAADFPKARLLVTSRLIGYDGRTLRDAGFMHWLLADFDEKKIATFLEHWIADAIRDPGDRPIVRQRLDDALKNNVIRELAGNPLLLTLMAVLARESDLPRDLGQLYKQAADLLLKQWDARRYLATHLEFGSHIIIDQKDKHDLLRDLAWKMQTSENKRLRGNLISADDVRAAMDAAFAGRIADAGLRRQAIERLLDQLIERNYILCHVGGAQFAFVHRGFLEFFASEHLVNLVATQPGTAVEEIGKIYRDHASDDAWQEVLILAATRFEPAVADQILAPMIDEMEGRHAGRSVYVKNAHPFALACTVLGRTRDPQRMPETFAKTRRKLEIWIRDDTEAAGSGYWFWLLNTTFRDDTTRALLIDLAHRDEDTGIRSHAISFLAQYFRDDDTRALLTGLARRDENTFSRRNAVAALAQYFPDAETRVLLTDLVRRDGNTLDRRQAVLSLAGSFRDDATRALLTGLARRDEDTAARLQAIISLAEQFRELPETAEALRAIVADERGREMVISVLSKFLLSPTAKAYLQSFL